MDIICDKKNCTGCGLCASLCPQQCIALEVGDPLGHKYPHIDTFLCIDCGICKKKCPVLCPEELMSAEIAFAAWSKDDDEYRNSTSGGAASVISRHVLAQGGVVYGCAMLPDIEVKHIRIDDVKDVWKLKGSKYVQSNVAGVYRQLKKDALEGRLTLFIGTPCQVAAVKKMFKNIPDNLLLVDLVCHGVPSVQLLRKHVRKVANFDHYDNIYFREGKYVVLVVVADGKVVYRKFLKGPRYKEWYINTFFDGYTYRDSCYNCRYACPERISDITIGDFWGLGRKIPDDYIPEHKLGCSLIMPITPKGHKFVEAVSSKLNVYERPVKEAVNGNDQLRAPFKKNVRIHLFRKLYPHIGNVAYRMVIPDKYVISKIKQIIKKLVKK